MEGEFSAFAFRRFWFNWLIVFVVYVDLVLVMEEWLPALYMLSVISSFYNWFRFLMVFNSNF